jgi:putative FmdB family regulatory protein
MPLYEYQCDACGQRFELIQKFSDPPPDACASCGKGPVHRQFSSPAIQFKGSGWYITDYAQKGKPEGAGEKADKAGTKTETKAESKADSKSESKAESKPGTKTAATTESKS